MVKINEINLESGGLEDLAIWGIDPALEIVSMLDELSVENGDEDTRSLILIKLLQEKLLDTKAALYRLSREAA